MNFACRGITHCDECGTTLRRDEFVICDMCRERAKEKNKQIASANKDKVIKKYIGYELMQAIAEGKIKEEARFYAYKNGALYFSRLCYANGVLRNNGILLTEFLTLKDILMLEFELIEDEEIDIQAIEEVNHYDIISAVEGKTLENINNELAKYSLTINELAQAVKQLDKRIKQ